MTHNTDTFKNYGNNLQVIPSYCSPQHLYKGLPIGSVENVLPMAWQRFKVF